MSLDPSAHNVYRRRTLAQKEKERELANENGIRAREMASIVRKADPSHIHFRRRDIYNDRQEIKAEKLNGLTATQAFVKELLNSDIKVNVMYDDDRRVCAVFWTYDWCRTMWKKFPEVLGLDNTYKTNRFKLYLFQVTGVTDQKSLANFAFGLINGEKEEHFQWLCDRLDELRVEVGADRPQVVITDKEKALRAALMNAFPDAQQQLCVYHILANVRAKINARWRDISNSDLTGEYESDESADLTGIELDLDIAARDRIQNEAEGGISDATPTTEYSRDGMFRAFRAVVYAPDHEGFKGAWRSLVESFGGHQSHILRYIQKEYMPWRKQWAKFYVDRYRNFGQMVNSPTETAHADVKSHLVTGTGDLYYLHQALVAMIDNKARSYSQEAARQLQRQRCQYIKQA